MTASQPDNSLDALRREIDSIDDQILALLVRRFGATARVGASKAQDGSISSSPVRPAREAAMLRRLAAQGGAAVPPQFLVRLWRVIISASSQSQAPITLHMDRALGQDLAARLLVSQYFCDMHVELHDSSSMALESLKLRRGDLAVIAAEANWSSGFSRMAAGGVGVIGTLPFVTRTAEPRLLVFGHAEPLPSGDDETLLVAPAPMTPPPAALWAVPAGDHIVIALPGFLPAEDPMLQELLTRYPETRIAGRCPRPMRASS
jgi:chorismate mutase/prephenate dehydratase